MKIDKELEIDFIRAIQKMPSERTFREEGRINKRYHYIENQFEFTPKVNEKIMLLNEKLRQEEKRVFYHYRLIEKQCNLMVANKEIDDFNIEVVLSFWNNKHYRKFESSVDGNSFFKTTDDFMTMQRDEVEYNPEPHNDHHDKAPFPEINHCYSFHNLYDHCRELTWFDIYNIDEVWMGIKADYQFFSKIK